MFKLIVKGENLTDFQKWRVQQFFVEEAEKTCLLYYLSIGASWSPYQDVEIRIETIDWDQPTPESP